MRRIVLLLLVARLLILGLRNSVALGCIWLGDSIVLRLMYHRLGHHRLRDDWLLIELGVLGGRWQRYAPADVEEPGKVLILEIEDGGLGEVAHVLLLHLQV